MADEKGPYQHRTGQTIKGEVVTADMPARSPLPHPTDPHQHLYYKTIRELWLMGGGIVYGCTDCDYTGPTVYSVRAHRSTHTPRRPTTAPVTPHGETPADIATLDALMARLAAIGKLQSERDRWRTKAIAAERQLAALRRSLSKVVT